MRTRPANVGRLVSVSSAYLRGWALRDRFERRLQTGRLFLAVQRRGAEAFTPLFRELVDRRFTLRDRFEIYAHDVRCAEAAFSAATAQALQQGRRVPVLVHEAFHIDLGVNEYSLEEGLWSLTLRSAAGRRLSSVSFSFLHDRRILIGSVQGPKMSDEEALAEIRQATHAFHGLRPPHLVLALLKTLARLCRQQLLGVDPRVKARLRRKLWRDGSYHFDYRAFWAEQGGVAGDSGYWLLPTEMALRPLSEVPSKKRAMYRRRGELLAGFEPGLLKHLA